MKDKDSFKDFINYVLIIVLFILAGLVIYPVLYAIIYGILIAYIFFPVHKYLRKKMKSEFWSALIVCLGLIIIIIAAIILIFGLVFNQIVNLYLFLQKIDIVDILRKTLPTFLTSSGISENVIGSLNTYVSGLIANSLRTFTKIISDLPNIIIQLAVVIFTFFFALKDGEKTIEYFKSVSPVKKETEDKVFKQFKEVTNSVLIGQIFVGIIQGIVAGIGYFIFGVPNATLLTFITIVTAMIPVVGAWLVWVPVDIYLFASGNTAAGVGLLIYGVVLVSWIDNLVRTIIISRKTEINLWVVLIGMLGGLIFFGFIGFLIGPLILAYVLLVIEIYRKNTDGESNNLIFKKSE
ncbi:MAG: AI-2E family transporter [Nanoarchaeota archaeon]|nr:AI-2E family transporter [Nanoarchaeota archaeon]